MAEYKTKQFTITLTCEVLESTVGTFSGLKVIGVKASNRTVYLSQASLASAIRLRNAYPVFHDWGRKTIAAQDVKMKNFAEQKAERDKKEKEKLEKEREERRIQKEALERHKEKKAKNSEKEKKAKTQIVVKKAKAARKAREKVDEKRRAERAKAPLSAKEQLDANREN